jgi:hypothetical protein
VPLAVVAQLWGSSSHEVEAEAATLVGLQLIDVDKKARALSMIDLHRDYLRCRGRTELAAWNAKLLRGCGRSAVGVNIGDEETDRYWGDGRRWVLHLCEGGAPSLDAVRGTVVDAKLTAIGMKPEEGSVMARLVAGCTHLTALDVGFNLFDEEVALAIVRAARRRDQMVSNGRMARTLPRHAHGWMRLMRLMRLLRLSCRVCGAVVTGEPRPRLLQDWHGGRCGDCRLCAFERRAGVARSRIQPHGDGRRRRPRVCPRVVPSTHLPQRR